MQTPTPVSRALVHTTCSHGFTRVPFHHFLTRRPSAGPHGHGCSSDRDVDGTGRGVGPEKAVGARPPTWTGASCSGVLGFPAGFRWGRTVQRAEEWPRAQRVFSAKQGDARSPSRAERKRVQHCPPKPGPCHDLALAAPQACPLRGSRPPRGAPFTQVLAVVKVPCGQCRPTVHPRGPWSTLGGAQAQPGQTVHQETEGPEPPRGRSPPPGFPRGL